MDTLKNCPALMDRICNIQGMKKKINTGYDGIKDFKRLEKMTDDQLWDEMLDLLPKYNKTFERKITVINTQKL